MSAEAVEAFGLGRPTGVRPFAGGGSASTTTLVETGDGAWVVKERHLERPGIADRLADGFGYRARSPPPGYRCPAPDRSGTAAAACG
jgi:hypothetical protein